MLYYIVIIILDAMITSGQSCIIFEIQSVIQSWLQHASDRVRYSIKKTRTLIFIHYYC